MNRAVTFIIFSVFVFIISISVARAQDNNHLRIIHVKTEVQYNPVGLKFTWPAIDKGTKVTIFRKLKDETQWDLNNPLATLPGNSTNYTDTDIKIGEDYEYFFRGYGSDVNPYTYIYGGIEAPENNYKGKLILIVDGRFTSSLATDLLQLENDLIGDGWEIIRHDVSPTESVTHVKNLIKTDYQADPQKTKAIFLFGHIPVPYTGNIAWDGHSDHNGAWPSDGFYADMVGNWTDETVVSTQASRPENRNIIGDGKYDQSYFPALTTLQIGRVDLYNMPDFKENEELLLKRYLKKNHDYRHKLFTAKPRALIDNNFGLNGFDNSFYASCGWRSFIAMFPSSEISNGDYFTEGEKDSYLWSYAAGGGTFTSAWGVGSSSNFQNFPPKIVFNMLFGSYFGDWDSKNNFLRAPLASPGWGLASCWAGRPYWLNHHLALGETLGYSTWITMRNTCYQSDGPNFNRTSINLMGDPTLRIHVVSPPKNLLVNGNILNWEISEDATHGYNIYKKNNITLAYEKIGSSISNQFVDENAGIEINNYMVRAKQLTTSNSGSYFNLSQGIFGYTNNVLPLDILSYKITNTNFGVKHTWEVKNQFNIHHIEIEKSYDMISFSSIAKIDFNEFGNYSYTDGKYYKINETEYYRLKFIDNDGKIQYSDIISNKIALSNSNQIELYPNPSKSNYINIQSNDLEKGNYQINIVTEIGIQVYQTNINHEGGFLNERLTVDLKSGNYLMIIKSDNFYQVKKLGVY